MYHPIDVQYGLMSCQVERLEAEGNQMYQLIVQSVANTHADSHSHIDVKVSNIFSLNKAGERLRFLPF